MMPGSGSDGQGSNLWSRLYIDGTRLEGAAVETSPAVQQRSKRLAGLVTTCYTATLWEQDGVGKAKLT